MTTDHVNPRGTEQPHSLARGLTGCVRNASVLCAVQSAAKAHEVLLEIEATATAARRAGEHAALAPSKDTAAALEEFLPRISAAATVRAACCLMTFEACVRLLVTGL